MNRFLHRYRATYGLARREGYGRLSALWQGLVLLSPLYLPVVSWRVWRSRKGRG